jgi:hypothetical protein
LSGLGTTLRPATGDRSQATGHGAGALFNPSRSTLLGFARNKFNEMIQHNRDLVTLLQQRPDIEILHFDADLFGIHPLNPTIRTVWRFRD